MRHYKVRSQKSRHFCTVVGFAFIVSVGNVAGLRFGTNGQDIQFKRHLSVLTAPRMTCLSDQEIANEIRHLASGEPSKVQRARATLFNKSGESQECRNEIIRAVMNAMDRPNLDFNRDNNAYFLWLYGSSLLGDLKAADAIDLLIAHLNLTNGYFNSSMNHQPALKGLLKMGSIALPKLSEALRHNPDPKIRYSAIYCIASIGGMPAVIFLKDALSSESDECAKRLIRVSLDSFDEKGNIENRADWLGRFTCNQ